MCDLEWPLSKILNHWYLKCRSMDMLRSCGGYRWIISKTSIVTACIYSASIEIDSGIARFPCDGTALLLNVAHCSLYRDIFSVCDDDVRNISVYNNHCDAHPQPVIGCCWISVSHAAVGMSLSLYRLCQPAAIVRENVWSKANQTVNDGVAHSKNPRKFAYHVTFDLDLDHTLDACLPGDHNVQVW